MNGWISIHRKIREHWLYAERRSFSKYEAWVDLLLLASHKEHKFQLGNEFIQLKKGELITSEMKLMEKWRWSKSKVRTFLLLLENDEMIIKKTDRRKTKIVIVNWALYQASQTTDGPQKDREQTTDGPKKDTINKGNNFNKGDKNKDTLSGDDVSDESPESDASKKQTAAQRRFDEFWALYPNKKAKRDAIKAWGKIKPDEALFTRIMDAVREQLQSEDWRKENGRFIPHPATWLNSGRWEDVVTPPGNATSPQWFKPSTGGRSFDEYRNGDETP